MVGKSLSQQQLERQEQQVEGQQQLGRHGALLDVRRSEPAVAAGMVGGPVASVGDFWRRGLAVLHGVSLHQVSKNTHTVKRNTPGDGVVS